MAICLHIITTIYTLTKDYNVSMLKNYRGTESLFHISIGHTQYSLHLIFKSFKIFTMVFDPITSKFSSPNIFEINWSSHWCVYLKWLCFVSPISLYLTIYVGLIMAQRSWINDKYGEKIDHYHVCNLRTYRIGSKGNKSPSTGHWFVNFVCVKIMS